MYAHTLTPVLLKVGLYLKTALLPYNENNGGY